MGRIDTRSKKTLSSLLARQKFGVLATHGKPYPYATLVACAHSADLKHLYFATMRDTRKYGNIARDPNVSILIDSRKNRDVDLKDAYALTVLGEASESRGTGRKKALKSYCAAHPRLRDFVAGPDCALMKVRVSRYVLVSRFQNVVELEM
ncbi:MAG TPA: pyridoxamine 5'-phosphate oxidase family protein [bacterium]|nr:pyridoxamine 5'-phosphate oxidase family protein [bacterium]